MTYTYSLDENDFLQYELYMASRNDRIKKQMTRGRVMNFIFFMSVGYFFFSGGNKILGSYFVVIGILMITVFPLYSKWRYKNYYKRQVRQSSSCRFNVPEILSVGADELAVSNDSGSMQIKISDITSVDETDRYLFLSVGQGEPIIIPKEKLSNIVDLTSRLNDIIPESTPYTEDLQWKW